jgi:hypothetical protein
MEVMIESLHHVVDQLAGIFLALLGEVKIEHGGFEMGMAHVTLDDARVDAGFEEMGGITVAQGVDRNAFFEYTGGPLGLAKGALDTALGHGTHSRFDVGSLSAQSWEEQTRMVVGEPVLTQQLESGLRQRDIAVLGALAPWTWIIMRLLSISATSRWRPSSRRRPQE